MTFYKILLLLNSPSLGGRDLERMVKFPEIKNKKAVDTGEVVHGLKKCLCHSGRFKGRLHLLFYSTTSTRMLIAFYALNLFHLEFILLFTTS